MALYVPLEYSHYEQETLSCWYIVYNPVYNLCFSESNWFLAPFWGFRSSINKNLWWLPRFLWWVLFSRLSFQNSFTWQISKSKNRIQLAFQTCKKRILCFFYFFLYTKEWIPTEQFLALWKRTFILCRPRNSRKDET